MTITNLIEQYKTYMGEYSSGIKTYEPIETELGIVHKFAFPLWLRNGDGIEVYIGIQEGKIIVSDCGDTYFEVSCCTPILNKKSKVRKNINKILDKTRNIKLDDEETDIFAEIPLSEVSIFPQRLQDFLCTIWSINLILC